MCIRLIIKCVNKICEDKFKKTFKKFGKEKKRRYLCPRFQKKAKKEEIIERFTIGKKDKKASTPFLEQGREKARQFRKNRKPCGRGQTEKEEV